MILDAEQYYETVSRVVAAGGGQVGPASPSFKAWLAFRNIPVVLQEMFAKASPHTELWAGSGALYNQARIQQRNEDFLTETVCGLLIVGTAPNGDHITIDLRSGATGYISHEHDWEADPRRYFVPVSPSFGRYFQEINSKASQVPEDYWEAIRRPK